MHVVQTEREAASWAVRWEHMVVAAGILALAAALVAWRKTDEWLER